MPTNGDKHGRVLAAGMLQVYDRFITIEEVMDLGQRHFMQLNGNLPVAQFRPKVIPVVNTVIDLLIEDTLVLSEAQRELTDKQKKMVEARVLYVRARMITEAGGSIERVRHDLAAKGVDLEQVLDYRRRRLTIDAYNEKKFMPSIVITRKMMWKYYLANRDYYTMGRRVQLCVIAVPAIALVPLDVEEPTDAQWVSAQAEARKMVRQAAKAVRAGEEFARVARRVGESIRDRHGDAWDECDFEGIAAVQRMIDKGGLWPTRSPDSFPKDKEVLARAATELEQGQVSKVEETGRLCYLIQAARVVPARGGFEDAQKDIEDILRRREYHRRKAAYLADKRGEFNRLQTAKDTKRRIRFESMVIDRVVAEYCRK